MRLFLATALLLLSNPALAAGGTQAQAASNLPPLLREVEGKYAKAGTLQAEFVQEDESTLLHRKKKSTGVIAVERPDKVRWQTLTPDRNLFVTDGKTWWFYTPPFDESEQGQLIERKSSEVGSKMMNALISGSFSRAKGVKVVAKSSNQFELTFKPGTAGTIKTALLTIDSENKLIQSVDLRHREGNTTHISLSAIKLGDKFPADFFKFAAPAGTQKSRR